MASPALRCGAERRGFYKGRKVYHTVLRKLRVSSDNLHFKLLADLAEFREHHEQVQLQYEAFCTLKEVLPRNHVMVQMDNAENWATSFMEEIQSAFFGKDQLTLHPMVTYHKDEEGNLLTKSYVGVTIATSHAFPMTLTFLDQLVREVKEQVPDLSHLHIVTDSLTSQYRNRYSCSLLKRAMDLFQIRITWNWLEAGHGKGPCDGVGGAIKGLADRVVKSTGSIQTADEFVEQIAPQTQKVKLLLAKIPQVTASAEVVKAWDAPAVHGLMACHQATVKDGKLYLRETSCYKNCCMTDDLRPGCEGWVLAKATAPPKKRTVPAAPASTPPSVDSGTDSDDSDDLLEVEEDGAGENQPGYVSEEFSSDEEGGEFEEFVEAQRKRAARIKRRLSRPKAIAAKAATWASAAQLHSDSDQSSDEDSDEDSDYVPPAPLTPRAAAMHQAIATQRRSGRFVNKLLVEREEAGKTSSNDWPVADILSLATVNRLGI